MGAALTQKLRWTYRKNAADFLALGSGLFPPFVYGRRAASDAARIPIFHFHTAEPRFFTQQLEYLRTNDYATITCDEYVDIVTGATPAPGRRVVMLTFDDGRTTTWTVAYPLLKRFGMRGVCFLIPGYIEESDGARPRCDELEPRAADELTAADAGERPLASWREIEIMHQAGVFDFQSHTLRHHLIHVGDEIVDFCQPHHRRAAVLANTRLPLLHADGEDRVDEPPPLGAPIYRSEPRMTDAPRYFDDEALRERCARYVEEQGGEAFFADPQWRRHLASRCAGWRREMRTSGRFETRNEQLEAQRADLDQARRLIEERLPGHRVRHLCYPWFLGGNSAVEASRETGHLTNYWGSFPTHYRRHRGGSPFHIPRLEDIYLFRLPGRGRWSLGRVLRAKADAMLRSRRSR